MDIKIVFDLLSDDSIEIRNSYLLNDRKLMKVKLFLSNVSDIDVAYGNKDIIICCSENRIIGEIAENILNFFDSNSIEYNVEKNLKDEIDKSIDRRKNYTANIEILRKIKNGELDNSTEFKKYIEKCNKLLKIKLLYYQYKSSFLLSNAHSGFDFSVPGSGKTIITYSTYTYLKDKKLLNNVLIIGPKNAYNAWYEEYNTCFGFNPDFKNLSETNVNDAKDYLCSSIDNHSEVTFINIDKIRNLQKELIKFLSSSNCMLVIDEGHKVKNPNASSTKAAMNLSHYAEYKIILTGTPMPNGYEDLVSLTYIISPFRQIIPFNYLQLRKFTVRGAKEQDEQKIMNSIYPFYSRVSKKYLIKRGELLPPEITIKNSEMSDNQKYIYDFLDGLIADYHNRWELEFEKILMKAILIRKMQVSSNPKLLRKSLMCTFDEIKSELIYSDETTEITNDMIEELKRKLDLADQIINRDINKSDIGKIVKKFINNEELVNKNILAIDLTKQLIDEGKKVILWDTFVENMDTLRNMLHDKYKIYAETINGTVLGDDRQTIISHFRNGNLSVLIASPATLAESISLHKCCQNAIYVNRNFNAAQFIQSKDRIHRINMPIGTTAHYIFLMNKESVDEGVSKRLKLKEDRMLRILDSDILTIGSIEGQDNSYLSDEDVEATFKL